MGKVCLAMVVANEQPVIERCLDSVSNLIDQICISINADDDGTQKAIEDWGKRHNIPTTIWFDPWKGYGPNKTRNLLKVRTELETDYILFLDADEVFITDVKNPLSYPTKEDGQRLLQELDSKPNTDVFYMDTHYGNHVYGRWQIIRNNQVWIWHLPWQEFLLGEKSNNKSEIKWLYNLARHQGHSSRHPDLPKNIKLLEDWVKNNPESNYIYRAVFYLGQGYKDYGDIPKAIEYLDKCKNMTGWIQERYIACLYLADIYKKSSADSKKRRENLLKCIDLDPTRLEAYHELMQDDFNNKKYRQALGWAVMAPNSRVPPRNAFLINKKIYDWWFDFQISIIAYYAALKNHPTQFVDTGIFTIGLEAIERCFDKLPAKERKLTISNKKFYTDKLPVISNNIQRVRHEDITIMVIENFYNDPMHIRNIALKLPFEVRGNYPGLRTKPHIEEGTKERIEGLLGEKIVYWPGQYNGSFQYTTAANKSWIHRDNTEWSLIVYLTPDAPVDGGTKTYVHKETGLLKTDDKEMDDRLNKDAYNTDAWDVLDKIGNRFNRAIMFKGRYNHMSDKYFGTCLEDGRLFQTFFFNTANFQSEAIANNIITMKGTTSIVTVDKNKGVASKKVTEYSSYNVFEREVFWLNFLNEQGYKWSPKLISTDPVQKIINMEYVGEPITSSNAPADWKNQLQTIIIDLQNHNLKHNDIKNTEVLVKDGKLYLIDYGWVSQDDDWSCKKMFSNNVKPFHEFHDHDAIERIANNL